MVVRRAAIALAMGLLAATAVTTLASPAQAADDKVSLRAPRTFNAGGNPGSVTMSIAKRTKGCVQVRAGIGIALPGLRADQVQVQAFTGGQWQSVGVSQTGGGVATGRIAPDRPQLCDRQETTARYRVAFVAGVPSGDATVVGEAFTAAGALIGRDAATSKVNGVRATPSPSRKPSPTPSKSSPTPTASAQTTVAPFDAAAPSDTPAALPAQASSSGDGGGLGAGTLVMVGGIGLVVVGAGLLVLLFLRARSERAAHRGGHHAAEAQTVFMPPVQAAGSDAPTMIMPRVDDR